MSRAAMKIKKQGRLLVLKPGEEYWLMDGVVYVLRGGDEPQFWCAENRLRIHLGDLARVLGRRFFTEDPEISYLDRRYFADYINA